MFLLIAAQAAMTFGGAAATAYATVQEGKQAEMNADLNAKILKQQAAEEKAQRAVDKSNERKQTQRRRAGMEAKYAKSGVEMSGTPLTMMVEQAETDQYNILASDRASIIKRNNLLNEANWMKDRGKFAKRAGYFKAGTGLLSGTSDVASIGASYNQQVGSRNTPEPTGSTTGPMAANSRSSLYGNQNSMLS